MLDLAKYTDLAGKVGVVGVLLAVIIALQGGYLVVGTQYERALKDAAEWKALALRAYQVAQDAPRLIGEPPPEVQAIGREIERRSRE